MPLDSDAAYDILVQNPSASGISVNRQTVLGYPAVWRGVRLVSSSIARLPLEVFRTRPSGGRAPDIRHPAYNLLRWQPSEFYTSYTFIETLISHAMLMGNGYAWVMRNGAGDPIELLILDPEATVVERKAQRLAYRTRIDQTEFVIDAADVIHLKNIGYEGLIGYSVIHTLRESLGLGLAYQKYGATFFANNAKSNLVIEMAPGKVLKDPEAVRRFRESIAAVHSGIGNAHKPLILEDGTKASPLPVNNEEAQWLQSREFDVIQVANILGLPPHKLGAKISSSYSSLEQENKAFLTDSLCGWLCSLEQELRSKLLRESEKDNHSHLVLFDRQELERPDIKTETEVEVLQVSNGLRTRDEIRLRHNLTQLPDDLGDIVTIPANITEFKLQPEPQPLPELMQTSQQDDTAPVQGTSQQDDNAATVQGTSQQEANRQLFEHTISRMVKRIAKHAEREAKIPSTFNDWLDGELCLDHRHVIYDSLLPVIRVTHVTSNTTAEADRLTDALINDLRNKLNGLSGEHTRDTFAKAVRVTLDTYRLQEAM